MKVKPVSLDPTESGVGTNGDACQHVADSWVDIATDAMCLLAERMVGDESYQQAILACDDISELETVQVAFLKATINEYDIEARAAALAMRSLLSRWPVVPVQ
ncbi:hypothetical protein [Roseovarius arcticus]|uniref:hypothetical protein n=1 Tax=Roseovarius arcticus TaxID=2547404 RepID=UPI0011107531|nr:hypothetical protein [Roseovarius arcticus]